MPGGLKGKSKVWCSLVAQMQAFQVELGKGVDLKIYILVKN